MSPKIRFDFKSIRFRLWLCFMVVVIFMLALIWGLHILLLNSSYEQMKIREVDEVASTLHSLYAASDEHLTETIQELSIANDLYVLMESGGSLLLFNPEQESVMPVYRYQNQIPRLREALQNAQGMSSVHFKFSTSFEQYNTLAYGRMIHNTPDQKVYLYIFSPLYPVESTVNILKTQLFTVTMIALILAFAVAGFLSTRIARPIKSMTATARRMGKGDYNVKFEGSGYTEINNLALSLNTAAYELGMADVRQKDLVANVSHDLKTPLTMIRSYAEMIRDLSGDNPEKRNAHLQVIIDESMRMTQLVSDMASISAMNTNKVVLEKEVFDICTVTASILASYEVLQEKEGYNFVYNHPKECLVYADKKRIEQVISNLTGNAIKYCGADKTVIVNIKRVGQKCLVEVTDYGPGIKPEELPHIWDRYYKTSTNYVRPTSGSGLGLSIVKEMLTLHRVNYGADSKVGKGSTFWFELDIAKKQLPQRTKQPSAEAQKDAPSGQPEDTSL